MTVGVTGIRVEYTVSVGVISISLVEVEVCDEIGIGRSVVEVSITVEMVVVATTTVG